MSEVCARCGHGAGWHGGVLAEQALKNGEELDLPCEYSSSEVRGFVYCECSEFIGDA